MNFRRLIRRMSTGQPVTLPAFVRWDFRRNVRAASGQLPESCRAMSENFPQTRHVHRQSTAMIHPWSCHDQSRDMARGSRFDCVAAAVASMILRFAHYNYCRVHHSLQGETPAMAARFTDHVWSIAELLTKSGQIGSEKWICPLLERTVSPPIKRSSKLHYPTINVPFCKIFREPNPSPQLTTTGAIHHHPSATCSREQIPST